MGRSVTHGGGEVIAKVVDWEEGYSRSGKYGASATQHPQRFQPAKFANQASRAPREAGKLILSTKDYEPASTNHSPATSAKLYKFSSQKFRTLLFLYTICTGSD